MKNFVLVMLFAGIMQQVCGQSEFPPLDKSPMDMCYYPADYPILKIQNKVTEPLMARIFYSRPQKNGRTVFGELVEFGKVWRLGANEATEIELYRDAKIGTEKLKKGHYTIYAIPAPEKWTVIFNRDTCVWGAFQYDSTKDVLRVEAPVQKTVEPVEQFTMLFQRSPAGISLIMAWDDTKAILPFNF